jgi:hypothetical protein
VATHSEKQKTKSIFTTETQRAQRKAEIAVAAADAMKIPLPQQKEHFSKSIFTTIGGAK